MINIETLKKILYKEKENLVVEWDEYGFKAALLHYGSNSSFTVEKVWIKNTKGFSQEDREKEFTAFINDNLSNLSLADIKTTFIIPEQSGLFKRILIPPVPSQDVESALKLALSEEISWPLDQMRCVWQVVRSTVDDKGERKTDVSCVSFHKNKIREIVNLCKKAGLICYGIYPGFFSLIYGLDIQEEQTAVLNIRQDYASLMFFDKANPLFVREIPFSWQGVKSMLCDYFKLNNITQEEADLISRNYGLEGGQAKIFKGVVPKDIVSALRPGIERLLTEIRRSFDYYALEFGDINIGKMYIIGQGSYLKGLDSYVSKELSVSVETADLDRTRLISKEKSDFRKMFSFLASFVGFQIRQDFNILPEEWRISKIKEIEKPILSFLIPLVSLLLIASFLVVNFRIIRYRNSLQAIQAKLSSLEGIVSKSGQIREKETFLYEMKKRYLSPVWVIKAVSENMPNQAAISSLDIDYGKGELEFKGYTNVAVSAEENLARFSQRLAKTGLFSGVNLAWLRRDPAGNRVRFEIICELEEF